MTQTVAETPERRTKSPRRALITLCLTQITSWGVLFYAFPVLAGTIGADTGWSTAAITGAFSVGLAVSAAAGVPVGRLLDRHGPRPVMTVGSVLAVAAVAAIAWAPNPVWFLAAWALAGVAQACVFYKPAFAALTVWYGERRVRALTALTLVAGLSSTIFAPLTASLSEHLTWRETYLVLGLILAAITIPAHTIGLNRPWPGRATTIESRSSETAGPAPGAPPMKTVLRSVPFIVLATVMALATFALFAATFFLVPLLTGRGMDTTTAAWALGLSGAGQLLGRIGYSTFAKHTSTTTRTAVILALGALTIAATTVISGPAVVVFAAVIALGAARGAFTLLEATAVADRWGTRDFGLLYGICSAPATIALATAPAAGAALAERIGGYTPTFTVFIGLTLIAALLSPLTRARPRETSPSQHR
ncbi:MFS transporter [Glycomyces tenuis]|uniref:MFS transporter n=1 Tax=Glycomyces tenuis TaxID=58116 RepID=UPI0003F4E0C9|nr:MFS transporter [Glycomyces tenuis]